MLKLTFGLATIGECRTLFRCYQDRVFPSVAGWDTGSFLHTYMRFWPAFLINWKTKVANIVIALIGNDTIGCLLLLAIERV